MPIVSAYKTDVGQMRTHNEDYVWVDEDAGIYIVADGLGGQEAGEVASQLTATTVAELILGGIDGLEQLSTADIKKLMRKALEVSNETVLAMANQEGQARKMGATIVVVLVKAPAVYICHAGDTRAYLARGMTLTQVTRDDSFVAELIEADIISKEEARTNVYRSVVTKAVGQDPPLDPTFTELAVFPEDWLLVCSDGLTDMVEEEAIMPAIQKSRGDPDYVVETLTKAANEAGGKDNISIIAIKILAEETP